MLLRRSWFDAADDDNDARSENHGFLSFVDAGYGRFRNSRSGNSTSDLLWFTEVDDEKATLSCIGDFFEQDTMSTVHLALCRERVPVVFSSVCLSLSLSLRAHNARSLAQAARPEDFCRVVLEIGSAT